MLTLTVATTTLSVNMLTLKVATATLSDATNGCATVQMILMVAMTLTVETAMPSVNVITQL